MSSNLCPKCHKPIRIPQEEVIIISTKVGRNKSTDRMVHKTCPTAEPVSQVGGREYCTNCGHAKSLHSPRCQHSSYDYHCDCKEFRK